MYVTLIETHLNVDGIKRELSPFIRLWKKQRHCYDETLSTLSYCGNKSLT